MILSQRVFVTMSQKSKERKEKESIIALIMALDTAQGAIIANETLIKEIEALADKLETVYGLDGLKAII